jgi:hypothetical protein
MNIICKLTVINVAMLQIFEIIPDKIYVDESVPKSLQKQRRSNDNNSVQFSFNLLKR